MFSLRHNIMDKKSPVVVINSTSPDFQVCVTNNRSVGSLGVWIGDNPFDFVVPITLCQIILVSLISRGLHFLLRPLQTPKFTCCIMAGILLGPTCLGRNERILDILFPLKQASCLTTLSKIGTAYSVFLITLKMDVKTTLKSARRCWRFGVFPFFASFLITMILLAVSAPDGTQKEVGSMYDIPNVFTLGSFAVVSEALTDLNLVGTELGQIALSSAMISEILQWITMGLQFNSGGDEQFTLVLLIGCFGFFVLCVCVIRPFVGYVVRRTPAGKPMKEAYVIFILLGVIVMAAISDIFGIYFVIGPTVYGLIMPNGPPLATAVIEKGELIIHEFLMPFFFLFIGLKTNFNGIQEHWKIALIFQAILFVAFLVKLLVCVLISPTYNIKPRHGLVLGLILSVKGITELIFYNRVEKLELINGEVFSIMVIHVVFMTALCIPLIKTLYKHHPRVLKAPSIYEKRVRTIQNIPENSEFNIVLCVHNDGIVHSMIALLEACSPSIQNPIYAYVIHLIELLGKSTPILLPMNKQNRKSLSVNYPNTNHILRAFENYSDNSSGPVCILSYVNVAPYNSMHDAVCNLAEDNSVDLLIIPFHQNDQTMGKETTTTIRNLNTNFLACARCTAGVLVDRYSLLSIGLSKLYFHVGIFFIGGSDDREALALSIKMLDRPNTRVTLLRFVLPNSGVPVDRFVISEEERLEIIKDDSLVDEFKGKSIINDGDDKAVCRELFVDDCIQVLGLIRGLGGDYDLVMVGKRHNIGDFKDEEMSGLMENADQLGIFGDMLASNEFCNGRVPVLVMQCGAKRVKKLGKL
ncbi:hypothetical protein RJT34_09150 [Clitoria ternatea]|uniref:Cation/H+ exchanger transmembrane domain-containing protein n=1 Tax=Clitoria ternatea TaxID=43366 RepID=A0AAN9PUH0_CLITE